MTKNIETYDKYIIAFSGGKDSTALVLYLLDLGIPKHKIELWHHLVDGKDKTFMDWEVTEDYCRKFAQHFGIEIYFSWKQGGFKREMNRENQLTAPIKFEISDYEAIHHPKENDYTPKNGYTVRTLGGERGKPSTRLKFPQISPDLSVRWCSAYLKIDICATAIRNQERFRGLKICILSGERGEESKARSNYKIQEPDRADLRNGKSFQRHVDRLRPIRDWQEGKVWEIIKKYGVVVHPCYYLGWSRCSCKFCIFGNANQFASAFWLSPNQGNEIIKEEQKFGVTMKRDKDLVTLIREGIPYKSIKNDIAVIATKAEYNGHIITSTWVLPSGAFGESCGPS